MIRNLSYHPALGDSDHCFLKFNIYMTAEALRLKNKKKRLWRRYARTRSSYDHSAFVQSKNKLKEI